MKRRRLAAAGLVVLAAVAVAVVLLTRGSGPADEADTFVPRDALAYLHVSTDPGREQDQRLLKTFASFPAADALQARVQRALGEGFDLKRDVRSWLGDEAAVAVTAAGVLLVLKAEETDAAQGVLTRFAGEQRAVRYKGQLVRRFPGGAAAIVGDFVLVGPQTVVQAAIDAHNAPETSLAELPDYERAAAERPDDRSADAWATGVAASLALPPRLGLAIGGKPLAASLVPTADGVRVTGRRLGGATPAADFDAGLLRAVPEDAVAYLGVRGARRLGALLPVAAGEAGPTLAAGLDPLLDELTGEVAVSVSPARPDPIITLVARADDPAAARQALADLQATIAGTLVGSEDDTGAIPTFEERQLDGGVDAYVLTLAGGGELAYAVSGNRVIVANADSGIQRAVADADGLAETDAFAAGMPKLPKPAEALAFVATRQLLDLADAAGLDASATYRSLRPDLKRIRTLGATLRRQGTDTIAELNLVTQ